MRTNLAVLLAVLAVAADRPSGGAVKKEWARLEGTWKLTRMEVNGKSLLQRGEQPALLVIKDGKLSAKGAPKGAPQESPDIRLDPTHTPKWVTVPNAHGGPAAKGITALGIYELKGDTLRVCVQEVETARLRERAKERPRAFDSKQGLLLVFRRQGK
jgi:uncharacterized protein (TIGR03067 family)